MNATGCRAQWAESRKRRVERHLANCLDRPAYRSASEDSCRLRSWRRCASIIRRYFRVTSHDSMLDGHRRCRRLALLCAGKRSNIRKPFQESVASKYGLIARASNFSSTLCVTPQHRAIAPAHHVRRCLKTRRELPPESPLGLTGKSERSLSRFELCSERRRTKKTQHVPTNATNAGDVRRVGRRVLPPPIRPIARDRWFGIAGEHHDL